MSDSPTTPSPLPLAAYPFKTQFDVRLSDVDLARHVNNAAIAGFYEEVRIRFHLEYFPTDAILNRPLHVGGVIAQVTIKYLRECIYGHPIVGGVGVAKVGRSSYTLAQALFQRGTCIGESSCIIAQRAHGRADRLGEAMRSRLAELITHVP